MNYTETRHTSHTSLHALCFIAQSAVYFLRSQQYLHLQCAHNCIFSVTSSTIHNPLSSSATSNCMQMHSSHNVSLSLAVMQVFFYNIQPTTNYACKPLSYMCKHSGRLYCLQLCRYNFVGIYFKLKHSLFWRRNLKYVTTYTGTDLSEILF